MSTRVRQTTAAAPSRRPGNELPAYEKPKFSLNPDAQRELARLHHAQTLKELDESFVEAQSAISNAAAEINDRLTEKDKAVRKRNNESSSDGAQGGNADEVAQSLDTLRDRVERMTERMEQSMRKMLDGRHSVQQIKDSLAHAAGDARENASTQASTQNFRSQRRRRLGTDGEGDEDETGSEDEYQDFTPTDPAGGTQARPSPIEVFRSKREDADTRYKAFSLTSRYADNNDYREFKKVVHDARYPDGDVPLAHPSEWFKEDGAPAPGVTTRSRGNAEDEDDDDIAVSKATVSTKCPLTLQEFQSPLTSKKCPHSFESEAILNMISNSANRVDNRPNGERYVHCPVSGCSQTLTRSDLQVDNVLVRQIKRIQRAKELEDEDMENGDHDGRFRQTPTVIEDGDGDGADVDDIVEGRVIPQTQMKAEPKGTTTAASKASAPPRSTAQVVDLGSSTEEDEAEEDEDEMDE